MDDFKDYPKSVQETRAIKEGDGTLWGPREVLIALLREIDEGLIVEALVCSYQIKSSGSKTAFKAAIPDTVTALGLIEAAKFSYLFNSVR